MMLFHTRFVFSLRFFFLLLTPACLLSFFFSPSSADVVTLLYSRAALPPPSLPLLGFTCPVSLLERQKARSSVPSFLALTPFFCVIFFVCCIAISRVRIGLSASFVLVDSSPPVLLLPHPLGWPCPSVFSISQNISQPLFTFAEIVLASLLLG